MPTSDDLSPLRQPGFVEALKKLEELMTQSRRSFLIGAGCSKCAGLPLTTELTDKTLSNPKLDAPTKSILTALRTQFDGASQSNIEDYLSELIDLLAIVERRVARGASNIATVLGGESFTPEQLRGATERIKRAVADVIDQTTSIETHWKFIGAVHRPIRPGKPTSNQSVDYLVLNYDTLIEDALALEKIPFADGMDGGVTGWWNPAVFNGDGATARVLKLHGSINWSEFKDDPLPRRVSKNLSVLDASDRRVLIWPASTKYRETQRDPYAQLAALSRQILRPAEKAQMVLVICGYSFSDSHINLELDRALRESEGRLTITVFSSDERPSGQVKAWHEDNSVREQVLVFCKRGFFHGDKASTSTVDLPWWKFEVITRILGGER